MSNVLCISTTLRDDGLVRDEQLLQREAFVHVQRVQVVLRHIVRAASLISSKPLAAVDGRAASQRYSNRHTYGLISGLIAFLEFLDQ